jgi:bifunctional non-homologous end joining protein LigD
MALPRVQPIIPTWRKEPFDDPEWLFDFKYDGFRGLCYLERGWCRFISRNGNDLSRFEALGDQLAALIHLDEAIIDGEVVAVDQTDARSFTISCGAHTSPPTRLRPSVARWCRPAIFAAPRAPAIALSIGMPNPA